MAQGKADDRDKRLMLPTKALQGATDITLTNAKNDNRRQRAILLTQNDLIKLDRSNDYWQGGCSTGIRLREFSSV